MWYGYVGPGTYGVYNNWETVENLSKVFPYSKYRKYREEEDAWEFVKRNANRKELTSVTRYGECFERLFVTVEYFVRFDSIYFNVDTKNLGRIRIRSDREDVFVENRTESVMVRVAFPNLNEDAVVSHAIAIYQILEILGDYIDVELIVPDHSIFYLLTAYTGSRSQYVRLLNHIEGRKGKISVTLREW